MSPAIVIFGCAVLRSGEPSPMLLRRVEAAFAAGAACAAPLYVPTGAKGRFGAAEADVMAALLRERGVRDVAILPERTGTDTLSSVRAVARLLRGRRGTVLVATSGFHQPRCVMLLRMAGIDARACKPPPAARSLLQRWYWRLREVPAIPYDAALMLAARLAERP